MKDKQNEYSTPKLITTVPIDIESDEYLNFSKTINRFPEEAVYIYSFQENRLIYAAGWEETLGYEDQYIDLQTIVMQTDPLHAPFAYDLNDNAVKFILSRNHQLLEYYITMEINKIHKNGSFVPMMVKLGVYSIESNGSVKEAIGRFQINKGLRFGKVIRYASHGPDREEFEEALNKALFKHIAISEKEKETISFIASGLSFKEIAEKHGVTLSAVEKRIRPMYKKFEVNSLPQLISFAYENFILP
ncbi:MAG: LuxR family transcriptional regulator [Sphingobacteriia bacterium]|nr:MAG: LuxR family transcriptional regulator [Sphingobacteriia bacterium]TAG30346.1 MAG: LuxR family transcriptional regulator [Sphingobacteriia bacterium]TAH08165.1 MAG: LuxR family transcriptional regulator [Sphingobacteriia bacterium]